MAMRCVLISLLLMAGAIAPSRADLADDRAAMRVAEATRIEVLDRAAQSVVCIFPDATLAGGGSGVLIDERGYGLTNFHVIAGMLQTRRGLGGLSDGRLYPLTVIGIDPGGDVALFKLDGRARFDFAPLGDSDALAVGQPVAAMGNPFMLATDYQPTITVGPITGLGRYQPGEGNALEYADCIQVGTSINPGNSGGPLFDMHGRVVGINGRASFKAEDMAEGRGRVNVGVGYAISINQIKRFLPILRAGEMARHGTLGATVRRVGDELIFDAIQERAPAAEAGIQLGDELLRINGRRITTPNEFNNIIASLPAGWPVTLEVRRGEGFYQMTARLEPLRVQDAPVWVPQATDGARPGDWWRALQPRTSLAPRRWLRDRLNRGVVAAAGDVRRHVVKIYGGAIGRSEGYGSGVIISPDGRIITTSGPLLDARSVRVGLPDGRVLEARVVRRDEQRQLALLQVDASGLDAATLAVDAEVAVGNRVWVAMNCFNIAAGPEPVTLVSATLAGRTSLDARRRAQPYAYRGPVLLIDAVVSTPGSAGGGLFAADGRLIGILGRAVIDNRTNTWLDYALPAGEVAAFLNAQPQLAAETPTRDDLTPTALGIILFDLGGSRQPAYIERVRWGSPARAAGLRAEDLIVAVGGRQVDTCEDFAQALQAVPRGEAARLVIKRGEEILTVECTPAEARP